MDTDTAVVWNMDATSEEVVSESVDGVPGHSLEGEPGTPDRRTRVEEDHYAPGGKYRGMLWIAHTEMVIWLM